MNCGLQLLSLSDKLEKINMSLPVGTVNYKVLDRSGIRLGDSELVSARKGIYPLYNLILSKRHQVIPNPSDSANVTSPLFPYPKFLFANKNSKINK